MRTNKLNLYYASFCAYLAVLSFGIMIGYTSPCLPEMERQRVLTKDQASWFGSLASIGAMFGSLIGGWLVQYIGRRSTLIGTSFPFTIGWFLIWCNRGVLALFTGRFLTGIASGISLVTSPMYISETCTKKMRGMMGSGIQLSYTIGILIVYYLGMSYHWYTIAAISSVVPILAMFMTLRIPESPRYLVLQNKKADATSALMWLRSASSLSIVDELRDIEDSLGGASNLAWSEFLQPQLMKPLIVAGGLMIFQQLCGINVVMFYTVSIFENAGFSASQKATVTIGVIQVVFTFFSCLLMDHAGRRFLLFMSGAGMALTCFSMGYYYRSLEHGTNISWLAIFSLMLYIATYSMGWGAIPVLLMSEIFPVKAKGTASGLTTVISCTAAFFITKEFVYMNAVLGSDGTFEFYGVCVLISLWFVYSYVPETKGKSLEEIEMFFLDASPPKDVV